MARINLLPWRDELRREQQKNFLVVLVIAVSVAVVVMFGVHTYGEDRINYQAKRNSYLKKEIAKLDKQIKEIKKLDATKKRLQARLNIIQRLQASRPEVVHLFDELVKTLPEGVFLTRVSQKGNIIKISGKAQSNARVSSYMWNLDKSNWLDQPKLNVIKTKLVGGSRVSDFTLNVIQKHTEGAGK
ncbi:MAG TPA: pilus assembly protein PilN [Gammaproteobacteria bacterium]|nr:pilus assembly protein PilN [Gammaproteobacteria bacterium]